MAFAREIDFDDVLRRLSGGDTQRQIADDLGINQGDFSRWLADGKRSARAREARILGAILWDEKAEKGIEDASDAFELAKAKELAHHYRWRASKIAPQYKDTVELSGSVNTTQDDPDVLVRKVAFMLTAAGIKQAKEEAERAIQKAATP